MARTDDVQPDPMPLLTWSDADDIRSAILASDLPSHERERLCGLLTVARDPILSPYEIEIMLHYFACADDHPHSERNMDGWRRTIGRLIAEGMIADAQAPTTVDYVITDVGRRYCEALRRVPVPR